MPKPIHQQFLLLRTESSVLDTHMCEPPCAQVEIALDLMIAGYVFRIWGSSTSSTWRAAIDNAKSSKRNFNVYKVIEGRFETVWDNGGRSTVNEWVAWLEKENGPKPKILLARRFSGPRGAQSGYVTSRFDFDLRGVRFPDNIDWQTNGAAPWEGWEEVE